MSKLSDRTAAGRHDVVPGYILSPPRLREQGVAEDAFARWYIERVERGTRNVAAELRKELLNSAQRDVRDGYFSIGMPGHDAAGLSARGTRLMFWLSLRIKHPQITYPQASELLDDGEQAKFTAATQELWGYVPGESSTEERKPVNWDVLYERLCGPEEVGGLGYSLEAVNDMTMGQVVALLSLDGAKASKASLTPGDVRRVAQKKQHDLFDKICAKRTMTIDQLCKTPLPIVATYVREIIGDKPVDEKTLAASLESYTKKAA